MKVLAADDMEGRETGSPGLRKAQEYDKKPCLKAGREGEAHPVQTWIPYRHTTRQHLS